MHGIVFTELKKYVSSKLGAEAWTQLLQQTGLGDKVYMPVSSYPDAEALALVGAATRLTNQSASKILEDFGQFIAPDLLDMYRSLIRPAWKTLDVLENTERVIHTVVRVNQAGAQPPELVVRRLSPTQATISYRSQRKMCALAIGITLGVAKHFNEPVNVTHSRCMLNGAPICEIEVSTASDKATAGR